MLTHRILMLTTDDINMYRIRPTCKSFIPSHLSSKSLNVFFTCVAHYRNKVIWYSHLHTHIDALCSSGLGRDLALEALKRGEKVIATGRSRSIAKLDDLKARGADVIELDVTSPLETLHEVAKKAVQIHGRIDVLVNNAGYILVGAIEEST